MIALDIKLLYHGGTDILVFAWFRGVQRQDWFRELKFLFMSSTEHPPALSLPGGYDQFMRPQETPDKRIILKQH